MNRVPATNGAGKRRALFLDRDGVINADHGYVYRVEDFEFIDGIFDLVRTARALGYVPVVVTNQSGIARGYFTEADFEALSTYMLGRFASEDAAIERIYHCPFHKDATVERYRQDHADRKPRPGMLLKAATDLNLDLRQSAMIGDKPGDAEAAHAAGLTRIALLSETNDAMPAFGAVRVGSLGQATEWLKSLEKL